jgi:hypothetical protein
MELMTYEDFEDVLAKTESDYYEGRWAYFSRVVEIIEAQNDIHKVLELGPSALPVVKDGDVMVFPKEDKWGRPIQKASREYAHDATMTPWPISDKAYDLFIALQVWEHLGGRQKEAFQEVMRISRMAILSFPYLWNCPKDNANYPEHHMIDEKIIAGWTLGVKPVEVILIPRTGAKVSKGPRIIYFWRF